MLHDFTFRNPEDALVSLSGDGRLFRFEDAR
jgi:hypothetical protein